MHSSSGKVDIKSIVTYHDRIIRTANLIGVEVPKTLKASLKKKHHDSSSGSESYSSDSDSGSISVVSLKPKKKVTPKCLGPPDGQPPPPPCVSGPPPPPPRPDIVLEPSQPPPVSLLLFLQKAKLTFEFSSLPRIRRAINPLSTGLLPLLMDRLCWARSLKLQTRLCQPLMRNQNFSLKIPSPSTRRRHQRVRSSQRLR